jgi:hypothetical protein
MKSDQTFALAMAQWLTGEVKPTKEQVKFTEDFMLGKTCDMEATEEFAAAALAVVEARNKN